MYDELIKNLRHDSASALQNCEFDFVHDWMLKAADAIEELSKRVPKVPHGRLIDADAFSEEMRKRRKAASDWYAEAKDSEILARAESAMISFTECYLTMKDMPTVIEAEEGE